MYSHLWTLMTSGGRLYFACPAIASSVVLNERIVSVRRAMSRTPSLMYWSSSGSLQYLANVFCSSICARTSVRHCAWVFVLTRRSYTWFGMIVNILFGMGETQRTTKYSKREVLLEADETWAW